MLLERVPVWMLDYYSKSRRPLDIRDPQYGWRSGNNSHFGCCWTGCCLLLKASFEAHHVWTVQLGHRATPMLRSIEQQTTVRQRQQLMAFGVYHDQLTHNPTINNTCAPDLQYSGGSTGCRQSYSYLPTCKKFVSRRHSTSIAARRDGNWCRAFQEKEPRTLAENFACQQQTLVLLLLTTVVVLQYWYYDTTLLWTTVLIVRLNGWFMPCLEPRYRGVIYIY